MLIVGASLGGLSVAKALRAYGHEGSITLVGDEPHLPYDRPPLSKSVLDSFDAVCATTLASRADLAALGLEFWLGVAAAAVDRARRTVTLADGTTLTYDALVIATGVRPRRLAVLDEAGIEPLYLRTLDDAESLRRRLNDCRRLCVVGSGFIGGEVASAARARGIEVTVVTADVNPLVGALGREIGEAAAALWRRNGVDLRRRTVITAAAGNRSAAHLELSDGSEITTDAVVVGVGAIPCVEWLVDSGLQLDGGVVCDPWCRAAAAVDVYATGDVAQWAHPNYGPIRIEHWTNAAEQADTIAHMILGTATEPFAPLPYFWSEQFDTLIQFVGRTTPGDRLSIIDGSLGDRSFAGAYSRDGVETGCVAFQNPRTLARRRRDLSRALAAERHAGVAL